MILVYQLVNQLQSICFNRGYNNPMIQVFNMHDGSGLNEAGPLVIIFSGDLGVCASHRLSQSVSLGLYRVTWNLQYRYKPLPKLFFLLNLCMLGSIF